MAKFYVTFPYRMEDKRNKYSIITATDMDAARKIAFQVYGTAWAFMYPESDYQEAIATYNLELDDKIKENCK